METIKNYLDNMFVHIPQTKEMIQLKDEIYDNMSQKYQELKENGKSENEAIGIVISEFGNIDELLEEFNVQRTSQLNSNSSEKEVLPNITLEEAESFMATKKKVGFIIGIGVALCLLGIVLLISTSVFVELSQYNVHATYDGSLIGLILMFVMIAIAVGFFIYGGMIDATYEHMKLPFHMEEYVKAEINERYKIFRSVYTISLVIAVCLCVLSPVPVFITQIIQSDSDGYAVMGVCMLLMIIAIAVFLFIYYGNIHQAYSQLLEIGDFTKKNKRSNKTIEVVASIVWPLATGIFLFLGFVYNMWGSAWVIFPVTGIVFGIFSSIVNAVSKEE